MEFKDVLNGINSVEDLKKTDPRALPKLCEEIRELLIDSVSKTGGHLSSNLGVVELTVALHRAFDSPKDKIIWDVGHQCYPHKILTGRKDEMDTLRQYGGISGFPKPYESEHDCFVCGHSSTSLSAAHGIAVANLADGNEDYVVAVIGDGALTGGQAYEALNTLGRSKTRAVVVINNNGMSISKNTGGISKYLSTLRTSRDYLNFKRGVTQGLNKIPFIGKPTVKLIEWGKRVIKTTLYHSSFFEELGFVYYGQVDGHNLKNLAKTFQAIKNIDAPVVVQVSTVKGKGYAPAEENPGEYHGVPKSDTVSVTEHHTFEGNPDISSADSYSSAMGEELTRLAREHKDIYAITAAMKYATGLKSFCSEFRDRFFDVGIAEQHAVTLSGGLASRGKLPVFAVYSTFLQRAIDQVINDIAIGEQHIVLAIDRAGIVGEDGETHNGIFDVPLLSVVPNIKIYSPLGYDELRLCLNRALFEDKNISAVRYPRGNDGGIDYKSKYPLSADGTFYYSNNSQRKLVISYGRQFVECENAVQDSGFDFIKLMQIVPLSDDVLTIALQYRTIYFVEEGATIGGIGMQMLSRLVAMGFDGVFKIKGIDNTIVKQGSVPQILSELGLSSEKLSSFII